MTRASNVPDLRSGIQVVLGSALAAAGLALAVSHFPGEAVSGVAALWAALVAAAAVLVSIAGVGRPDDGLVLVAHVVAHPRWRRPLRAEGRTRVSRMRSFRQLVTAYWLSERWVEAWSLTIGIFALTTLISKSSVWAATATADFLNAIVRFHHPADGVDPVALLITSVAAFGAIHLARIGGTGVRHFLSTSLHRKGRSWMQGQFSSALLNERHIAMGLMSNRDAAPGTAGQMPDNVDQRVDVCTDSLFAGVIGLSIGIWGAVASIYFVSNAIIARSVEVAFLERWFASLSTAAGEAFGPAVGAALAFSPGEYGSALLVACLIAVYVPAGTWLAWRLGRILERQTLERQARDGSWRGELNNMLGRSSQVAISGGERVQARTNAKLYGAIDETWHRQNMTTASFLVFTESYNFLSRRLVSYLPALPSYLSDTMSFRTYSATSELAAELISDCSWFIQVMPAVATLKANARRLMEVADAIERASDQRRFYGETGTHDFRRLTQAPAFGLTLRDLALCHRGHTAAPFLSVPSITLRPGHWAYVRGDNGSGKSSLLKAIAGLWPYGWGDVVLPEGARLFFAGQDPDLPTRLTLKELVTYPHFGGGRSDIEVAAVLSEVGLGRFIRELDEELYHGKPWNTVFSGGQRQRLVLARMLLQRPDVILLDEACSALDGLAVMEFHRLLRDRCPDSVVISVMHSPIPPAGPTGKAFYDSLLVIEDGQAELSPLGLGQRVRLPVAAE